MDPIDGRGSLVLGGGVFFVLTDGLTEPTTSREAALIEVSGGDGHAGL